MPRCIRPRPETMNSSAARPCSTRRATFVCSSLSSRSRICSDVTYLPSRPAKGPSLTWKVMLIVGSSIATIGSALGCSGQAIVSPISTGSRPATAQISPASTSSARFLPSPSNSYNWTTFCSRVLALLVDHGHRLGLGELAREDLADGHAPDVVGVLQRGHQHLQRLVRIGLRGRDTVDDRLEDRLHVAVGLRQIRRRPAFLGRGVDHRESPGNRRWPRARRTGRTPR